MDQELSACILKEHLRIHFHSVPSSEKARENLVIHLFLLWLLANGFGCLKVLLSTYPFFSIHLKFEVEGTALLVGPGKVLWFCRKTISSSIGMLSLVTELLLGLRKAVFDVFSLFILFHPFYLPFYLRPFSKRWSSLIPGEAKSCFHLKVRSKCTPSRGWSPSSFHYHHFRSTLLPRLKVTLS